MDEKIINYLRSSPGSSANNILHMYNGTVNHEIVMATIYTRLRKLKRKKLIINKGNRWYINLKQ